MNFSNKIDGFRALWQFDNRWELIFSRIFNSNKNISIYRYKGLEVMVDRSAGEAAITGEVIASPMYRKFFAEMNFSGPINVLDVGSNNGSFPLAILADGHEIKKLVCVEMNPSTFARLRHNVEHNFKGDAKLINGAVCGEHREIEVALGAGGADDSIYVNNSDGETRRIQGYTLDEICDAEFNGEDIDLCKLDIEGAEFEVLKNPGHEYLKKCRNLLIEIHHHVPTDRIRPVAVQQLRELGFVELYGENKNDENQNYVHFFRRDL